ncbi:MAG: GPW/gp25 family protein [Oscillospiraceae bacterium]|nr:GPW/gp25 family protein [Oscillospiraceae bacterium]
MGQEFLGSGIKFPPQVNPGTGRFAVSKGNQSVKESVYLILMTGKGERWLVPNFGSRLSGYTFMDTSLTMLNIMANDIRMTLTEQEPRITGVSVDVDDSPDSDCLTVNISYTVRDTNTSENLVFPFYLRGSGLDDE